MYIIVGLGNPGKEYQNTRHNIGYDVIDQLAEKENITVLEKKHKAIIGKGYVAGQKCILAKPVTYMNLSGESVRELIDYYKRVKMGVGAKPAGWDLADYVLGHFSDEERRSVDEAAEKAVEAIRMMVIGEADGAMNRYNTKKEA
jgi:PTH1 family peptidyl-tRNA hydrolase